MQKQVMQLKTEVVAAKLAAQHASKHAQNLSSIWKLPQMLANSVSVHEMSSRWLEEQPEQLAAPSPSRLLMPVGMAAACALVVVVFLYFPRYMV